MTEQDTLAHLRGLNAAFIENYIANDVAAHDALLHPAFAYISGNGRRMSRADYLEGWATGFDPVLIPYWDTRNEIITVVGSLALVSACNKYVEVRDGAENESMAAYTDTYLQCENRWLCIQAQITPVAPDFWPPDDTIVSIHRGGVQQPTHWRKT